LIVNLPFFFCKKKKKKKEKERKEKQKKKGAKVIINIVWISPLSGSGPFHHFISEKLQPKKKKKRSPEGIQNMPWMMENIQLMI
jgi:hypothetical protein